MTCPDPAPRDRLWAGEHLTIGARCPAPRGRARGLTCGEAMPVLFVGDDWAEDHHDVEILDNSGKRLARARLPEGMAGMTRLHELLAPHLDEDAGEAAVDPEAGMVTPGRVVVGIETDRGPWVAALIAAGYQVFAINPMSVARYRERHSTSGAKSDP